MRIGCEESPFNRFGDDKYKRMAEIGYVAADYNLAGTSSGVYTMGEAEGKEFLLKEKELAKEAGVDIVQTHGPWRWPCNDSTPEHRAERMEKMKRSIEYTALLGCKNWVIHPIMPFGTEEINSPNAVLTWDMNKEFMAEILSFAKANGVVVCFENMPFRGFSLGAPEPTLDFVKEMNDEGFKICFDTGHAAIYSKKLSVGDAIRKMGSEIRCLHVHDNNGWVDMHSMPLHGIVDWQDVLNALKEIKYDGVFSLETAPSAKLPDDIFLEMHRIYYRVTKSLIE